ncbi:MAG: alpha/beta hydrolase family protein [Bdellovibrionia bacterium]
MKIVLLLLVLTMSVSTHAGVSKVDPPRIVHFENGDLNLGGEMYVPSGKGPFPAVLYNHGSAPGMLNSEASKQLGPLFAARGWIFFMPYRRGQGLSSEAGPYIGDEIKKAAETGGERSAAAKMVQLLKEDHLNDQMAALKWLKEQDNVLKGRIAVAGNSFGGIEVVFGASEADYCAAVDASGAAESWEKAPILQSLLKTSVRKSKSPIFFFQAENDFNLEPSRILSAEMKSAGKVSELKIYPSFGTTNRDGHSFAYLGHAIWFDDVMQFLQKHCR